MTMSPGPFKAPSGPLPAKELMTKVPLVNATPPVPAVALPPPVKVLLPVRINVPEPPMVRAAIPAPALPEILPVIVEKSVVVVVLSVNVIVRVVA